jgi:hypothetical protein
VPDPIRSSFSPNASYVPEAENQCLPTATSDATPVCAVSLPAGAQSLVEKHYSTSSPVVPEATSEPRGSSVRLCAKPAEIPILRALGLEHRWLMTASKEAGMGAAGEGVPGDHSNVPFVTQTAINDHAGEHQTATAHCEPVANVDEACVDEKLNLGAPLGRWTPQNQCQTFAEEVLNDCTPRSLRNDGAEGAPGY